MVSSHDLEWRLSLIVSLSPIAKSGQAVARAVTADLGAVEVEVEAVVAAPI